MRLHALFASFLLTLTLHAVEPQQVVVIANSNDPDSLAIAEYYLAKRNIPEQNLITIATSKGERLTCQEFVEQIFNPLREKLVEKKWMNAVLSDDYDAAGRRKMVPMGHSIGYLVLCRLPYQVHGYEAGAVKAFSPNATGAMANSQASVDSELTYLPVVDTPLAGPGKNPLFQQKVPNYMQLGSVIKVARLDGPSVAAVKRLIDSALLGEANGLKGRGYIDKGGPHKQGEGWLDQATAQIEKLDYPVSIDTAKPRFGWTARMDAPAIYFGWWTHTPDGPFSDQRFRFPAGAVAIHISSFSGQHLRKPNTRWGGGLVERGVAATVGNVYEPYLQLTNQPQLYLGALMDGMSAGDAAYYSLQGLSWMTIVLGDPLYQPFKVSLEEQLENLDPTNELSQYVVLRQAEKIRDAEGDDAAFEYLRRQYHHAPGLAIAYEIALGWEKRFERAKAVAQLDFVTQMTAFAPENVGLAFQISELFVEMREREKAYQILRVIANDAPNRSAKLAFLPKAIPLANQFGDRVLAKNWQSDLDAIKEQMRKEAEERKARREAAKAAKKK
ncbi:TIGR03790 family protein [Cerasicoccus maritimus]|uniref:TIGR03790 family protein n=1 Tax=Cerasicoccus maritimus TaxID=490089 RepID=UPI0028527977|nr:TIGR03790 family protein [Cerasicoccus maritimus]